MFQRTSPRIIDVDRPFFKEAAFAIISSFGSYRVRLIERVTDETGAGQDRYKEWYSTAQHSTVQYSTVQYSTVQYSTVQYSTVQYSTVQYSIVQC